MCLQRSFVGRDALLQCEDARRRPDPHLGHSAARAATLGVTSQHLAVLLVEEQLAGSWTWIGDDPGQTSSATPGTEDVAYELNDVMDEFDAELERRLAARSSSGI